MENRPCCEPSAEELELLRRGDCMPEELWGGKRPTCPKCVGKDAPVMVPAESTLAQKITQLVETYPRVSIIGRKEKGYRFVVSVKDDAGNNLAVGKAFTVMSAVDQVIAKLTNGA